MLWFFKFLIFVFIVGVVVGGYSLFYPSIHKSQLLRSADLSFSSSSVSFMDYRIDSQISGSSICGLDSSGFLVRGCCANFKVYRDGVLINSVPDSPVGFISDNTPLSLGVFGVDFVVDKDYDNVVNRCNSVTSVISFNSLPQVVFQPVLPDSSGSLLDFRVNFDFNWSYPVLGVMSFEYDKQVFNRSFNLSSGRSSEYFTLDLGDSSGFVDISPSLTLFLPESSFSGFSKPSGDVLIGKYEGQDFRVKIIN